jgi:hypothetical protein
LKSIRVNTMPLTCSFYYHCRVLGRSTKPSPQTKLVPCGHADMSKLSSSETSASNINAISPINTRTTPRRPSSEPRTWLTPLSPMTHHTGPFLFSILALYQLRFRAVLCSVAASSEPSFSLFVPVFRLPDAKYPAVTHGAMNPVAQPPELAPIMCLQ